VPAVAGTTRRGVSAPLSDTTDIRRLCLRDEWKGPMELLMVRFEAHSEARTALDELEEASEDGRIEVADAALVYRTPAGALRINQPRDLEPAGTRAGAPSLSVGPRILRRVGEAIEGPEAVILVAAEDAAVASITGRLEARLGAAADYLVLTAEEAAEAQAALQ
jgi:hypothetical protein